MSANENTVMNDPEERQKALAEGLNNLASPEPMQQQQQSPAQPQVESTPTPKGKKGKFASMASSASSAQQQPQVQQPQQTQAPPQYQPQTMSMNPSSGQRTQIVSGRIVGAGAKEPDWTQEQLQEFAGLRSTKLDMVTASDSRKAEPDAEGRYVVKNIDGTCVATPNSILPNIPTSEFKIGLGAPKPDERLPKKKMYSDVVMIGKNDDWVLNQWLSADVIMEPVPASIRNRGMNIRGRGNDRTIGVHFARFGFPAKSFASIFHTLDSNIPGLVSSLVMTNGYYWTNASWGVTQTPGTFVYMTEQGTRASTPALSEAMDMIGTQSSIGVGTFAISVACAYEKQGDQIVANSTKYEFSIKCHSFVHFDKTDWHGPPQTSAIGMMVGDDMMSKAKPLSKPKAVSTTLNTTGSLFSGANMNPFSGMNTQKSGPEGEKQGPGGNFL